MAKPTVFVDAGALFARYRVSDDHHQRALEGWAQIGEGREVCVTTNLVVAEAAGLLIRWTGASRAAPRIRSWFETEAIQIEYVDLESELEALDLLEKFGDQHISFIDCVSFAVMKHLGVRRAFSFDKHFAIAGFELWPNR